HHLESPRWHEHGPEQQAHVRLVVDDEHAQRPARSAHTVLSTTRCQPSARRPCHRRRRRRAKLAPMPYRETVAGLVVAGAITVLGLGGAQAAADRSSSRARARTAEDGAASVGRVSADIADAVEDSRRVAAAIGATGRFSPTLARTTSPVLDAVAF